MKAKEFLQNKYPINTWENKEALFLIEQMEEYAKQNAIEFAEWVQTNQAKYHKNYFKAIYKEFNNG